MGGERTGGRRRSGVPRGGVRRVAVRPLPPAVVAVLLWRLGHGTGAVLAGVAAVLLLVVGLAAPGVGSRFDLAVAALAGRVGSAVATSLAALGWAVLVVPVWGMTRLGRLDPLDHGWSTPRTNWAFVGHDRRRDPSGCAAGPGRLGARDLESSPPLRRRRTRGALAAGCLVLLPLVAAMVVLRSSDDGGATPAALDLRAGREVGTEPARISDDDLEWNGIPVDGYAHEGEPWFRDHLRELIGTDNIQDLVLGVRNGDFRGRHLNVVDGRRATWTPPDPQMEVWFFGGSTMYGIGQRDHRTIPSVVARAAAADGIRIRATNFGVSGDVSWTETLRFAEALESDLPRPDLVVFYDGVNDRGLASFRVDDGNIDPEHSDRFGLSEEERAERRKAYGEGSPMPYGAERDDLEVRLAAAQYNRSALTARALAASAGVPVVHVWQPQPFAKPFRAVDRELYRRLDFDPRLLPDSTRRYAQVREDSGIEPVDLSRVLDDVGRPVYWDSSHTNELGARIVGRALYEHLRPQLGTLLGGDG